MRHPDEDDTNELTPFFIRTPVMVGIIAGVTLVLLFITVASCFFCSCCFVYKKRQAHLTGGLYRMQCSSSTASGFNMYSPSSTSNHNSLVTTPLDMEWSQQQQNHHREHLLSLPSSTTSNGLYSASSSGTIPNGFPPPHQNHHQNYNHVTLPRYSTIQQPPSRPLSQHQNQLANNLPPPVFYPQNHLGGNSNGSSVGAPYSLTSSNTNGHYSTTPRPHHSQSHHNYNHPNLTLSTISSRTTGTQSQNNGNGNGRGPTSILRVTNCAGQILPPSNSFNSSSILNGGIWNGRTSSEIIINGGGHHQHHPHAALMTLGRRNSGPGTLHFGTVSNSFSPTTIPAGIHLNQKPQVDRSNFCVGGSGEAVSESLSNSCTGTSSTSHNRSRPSTINCHSNFQRLTACLSSSDSQHQGLHASAL